MPGGREHAMLKIHRLSATVVLSVCLIGTSLAETLFASGESHEEIAAAAVVIVPEPPAAAIAPLLKYSSSFTPVTAQAWSDASTFAADDSKSLAQRRGRGGYYGRGRHNGAAAALVLGAAAAIAGTAVLVYANRPECSTNVAAGGCGYGTKVVGGAVLSAGIVGVIVGAATWRYSPLRAHSSAGFLPPDTRMTTAVPPFLTFNVVIVELAVLTVE